jgi:DNA-binding Xre family transcriptional regulator
MIVIDTTIRPVPTSTPEVLTFVFHPMPMPIEPVVEITPRDKTVFSEEEALAILFPDAESKKMLQMAMSRLHRNIRENIRRGELNPIRGWRMIREMDQTELSRATGILQPNLVRMERPGANLSIPSLRKIAKALQINIEELIQ